MWHQLNIAKVCAASKSLNFDLTTLPTLIGVNLGAGHREERGTNATPIFFYVRIVFLILI